jgi:hypothetical protein
MVKKKQKEQEQFQQQQQYQQSSFGDMSRVKQEEDELTCSQQLQQASSIGKLKQEEGSYMQGLGEEERAMARNIMSRSLVKNEELTNFIMRQSKMQSGASSCIKSAGNKGSL